MNRRRPNLLWLCIDQQRWDTIVLFMSDHGEMLGDHGLYFKGPHFYEAAIRVPLVIRWPGELASDLCVDGITELSDLTPTLCELAEIETSAGMQRSSLASHLRGKADPDSHRDSVFCEYHNA